MLVNYSLSMKLTKITITRKFNLGKNTFENQDISAEFDFSEDEPKSIKEKTFEAFQAFHWIIEDSDLPQNIKDFYFERQKLLKED